MDETELDDEIPEYYVEHVSNILADSDVVSIVKQVQCIDDETLQKSTIEDLLREQCNHALCRGLMNKVDDTDSIYFLDNP